VGERDAEARKQDVNRPHRQQYAERTARVRHGGPRLRQAPRVVVVPKVSHEPMAGEAPHMMECERSIGSEGMTLRTCRKSRPCSGSRSRHGRFPACNP